MKVIGAIYLIWMLFAAALGAVLGSDAFCHMASAAGAARHPLLATGLHVTLMGVLFLQGLVLHVRMPSNRILALGFFIIIAVLVACVHWL